MHRLGIDHRSGIAPGDVLAEARLVPGLVVDAGIGGDNLHAPQALDDLALFRHLGGVLPEPLAVREIDAARVRRRANAAARAEADLLAQELEAAVAHHLDVAHQVDIRDGDHAPGLPEAAALDLVLERASRRLPQLAGEDPAFLGRQFQALLALAGLRREVLFELARLILVGIGIRRRGALARDVRPLHRELGVHLEPLVRLAVRVGKDRLGRALGLAHPAVDAVHVLALDAVFGDDVGHALIIAFRAPTFAMSWTWE